MLRDSIDMVSSKGQTLDTPRIHRKQLRKHIMLFYQGKDEEVADGFSSNPSTCQQGCIPKINMIKFVLGGRQECCWCWHKSSRGKDDISSHEFNWHLWRSQSVTVIKTKFVERLYEDAIEQKRKDEVKGYENHRFDTSSKSSLLFEVKW